MQNARFIIRLGCLQNDSRCLPDVALFDMPSRRIGHKMPQNDVGNCRQCNRQIDSFPRMDKVRNSGQQNCSDRPEWIKQRQNGFQVTRRNYIAHCVDRRHRENQWKSFVKYLQAVDGRVLLTYHLTGCEHLGARYGIQISHEQLPFVVVQKSQQ